LQHEHEESSATSLVSAVAQRADSDLSPIPSTKRFNRHLSLLTKEKVVSRRKTGAFFKASQLFVIDTIFRATHHIPQYITIEGGVFFPIDASAGALYWFIPCM